MKEILYDWFGLNNEIFLAINQFHIPALDPFLLLITSLGHPKLFPFYLAFAVLLTWFKPSSMAQKNIVIFAVSYVITSMILVPVLKATMNYPRPLALFGEHAITISGQPDLLHAFPSGHAAYAVLMAASLTPSSSLFTKCLLISFAILVCVSRISVGAHFPADVIGGTLISLSVVLLLRWLLGMPGKQANEDTA